MINERKIPQFQTGLLIFFIFLLVALPGYTLLPEHSEKALDAVSLIRAVETQYQGDNSHGVMRMTIKTSRWSRTLTMESWTEGREKFLTRILAPAKEKGICTLKVDNDIWNYLPGVDRLIKIPSSLMGESWMGSHLTNDDLVKENKIDELYKLEITNQASSTVEITGIPSADAAVVWGKLVYKIDIEKMVPLTIEFFDEDGEKVRLMTFSEVKMIENRWLPMLFRITPLDKPQEFTEVIYQSISFSFLPPAGTFSLKSMRNR
ncbi:MAG: outer membrane lipoprotein-sorting protein [Candidatus Riflebacteria bacterium]|nr:outer membrane lipoprotein-sorting protein [Candidatus Riflebacteria bacterium]